MPVWHLVEVVGSPTFVQYRRAASLTRNKKTGLEKTCVANARFPGRFGWGCRFQQLLGIWSTAESMMLATGFVNVFRTAGDQIPPGRLTEFLGDLPGGC